MEQQKPSTLPAVRIFVSSPGDVREERAIAQRVLQRLQAEFATRLFIDPFFWENEFKDGAKDYQENIEPPSRFDLFLCILWSRIGTRLHPEKYQRADGTPYLSGTEYEFEDALNAYKHFGGKPNILLFHKTAEKIFPARPEKIRQEQIEQFDALTAFMNKLAHDSKYGDVYTSAKNAYADVREFEEKLTKFLTEYFSRLLPAITLSPQNITWHSNPYRGLEYFDYEHAPIFQGRAEVSGELLKRLFEQFTTGKPFLLVGGSSGVGKSSLVRAGLLPLLLRPYRDWNTAEWRYAELRPSDVCAGEADFADTLARALTQKRDPGLGILHGAQTRIMPPSALPELLDDDSDSLTLGQSIRENMSAVAGRVEECLSQLTRAAHNTPSIQGKSRVRLCLLLDQMEEFFTAPTITPESREQFFKNLRMLVERGLAVVVGTMRTDCLEYCETLPDLLYLKDGNGYYHLSPPTEHDIARIIRRPAQASGVNFEVNKEGDILDDTIRDAVLLYDNIGKGTASLPMLEFTLSELYEKAKNCATDGPLVLTFAHYEELGGLEGAIATKADAAFAEFAKQHDRADAAFSHVMRHLITGVQDTYSRQKASRAMVDTKKDETYPDVHTSYQDGKDLVDTLINARLLVTGEEEGQSTVWIAHEALLRHWGKLKHWLEQEREYFAIQQRLEVDYAQWAAESAKDAALKGRHAPHTDLLLPEGKRLRDAEYLRDNYTSTLSKDKQNFIKHSRQHAERKKRLLQWLAIGLGVGVILASIAGGLAWWQRQETVAAQQKTEMALDEAEKQRFIAQTRGMASSSLAERTRRFDLSLLLGVAAMQEAPDMFESRNALLSALQTNTQLKTHLMGHTSQVEGIGFSKQGVLVSMSDNSVILWDVTTAKPLGPPMQVADEQFICMAISPTKEILAVATFRGTIYVWDLVTQSLIGEPLVGHKSAIVSLTFDTYGESLASVDIANVAILWDVTTQRQRCTPIKEVSYFDVNNGFSQDGQIFVAFSEVDDSLIMLDVKACQRIPEPTPKVEGKPEKIRFSHSGSFFATSDTRITVWDTEKRTKILESPKNGDRISQNIWNFAIGPFDDKIVYATRNNKLFVWDGKSNTQLHGHQDSIWEIQFTPDGTIFATSSSDGSVRLWDAVDYRQIGVPMHRYGPQHRIDISPDGALLASSGNDGLIQLWHIPHKIALGQSINDFYLGTDSAFSPDRTLHASAQHYNIVVTCPSGESTRINLKDVTTYSVAFSPDSTLLASAGSDNEIKLWYSRTLELLGSLKGHTDFVTHVEFSRDGKSIVSSGHDGTIKVWDTKSLEITKEFSFVKGERVNWSGFSPDGKILVAAGSGVFQAWDTESYAQLYDPITLKEKGVHTAAFSPDGKILATASSRTMRLWEVATGTPLSPPLAGHRNSITALAFSPDGELLVSGGSDNMIRLWDVATQQILGEAFAMQSPVRSLTFLPSDSTQLLSSDDLGNTILWELDPALWQERACKIANRNLSCEEWTYFMGNIPYRKICDALPAPTPLCP